MIAIVTAHSDRDLKNQMFDSLMDNTDARLYGFYKGNGMKDGEMKTVNRLVQVATKEMPDWTYLVRADDDLYFNKGWLEAMLGGLANNPDVKLLGACRYPTHEILEERDDIYIMDISPGNHWMISRETWDKYGPFYEDFTDIAEDVRFCNKLQKDGFKVACLKNPLFVVHCGIKNTRGKGRSKYVEGYTQALADAVGCETNR